MTQISISKLKQNPAKAISLATDYPVAVSNRNEITAYLLGKDVYEKLIRYVEDYLDEKAIQSTDFTKGKDLEQIVEELGL